MFDLTGKTVKRLRLPVSGTHYGSTVEFSAKQGDVNSRFLEITLIDDDGAITVPAAGQVQLNFTRADGQSCNDFGEVHDGKILVRFTSTMLETTGRAGADLSVSGVDANSDPYLLTSSTFYVEVEKTNYNT